MKLLYSAGQLETAADVSSTVETGRQAFCADHKNCDFNENPPAAKAAARGFLILSLCRPPDRERETLYLHLSLNIKYSQKGAPIVFECIIICRFCAQWSCFGFGNLHTDIHAGHLKKRKGMYENVFDREVFGCGKQCGGRICRHGSACSRKRLCRTDGHAWGLPQNSRGALRRPDSVALLSLLARMRTGDAGFALEAVHVNHGIRGGEADRDEEFCVSLCAQLRIPLTVRRADVPALAKRGGLSLEEAAREARYAVFAQICREKPEITHVATAHHASDNAETVLLHMIRGSGGRGLSGIPPSRPLSADSAVRLIRPLLCVDRADILRYLAAKELPFVSDSSNEDCRFARNALRHTILPLLHKMNPSVTQSLNRTAALAAQDEGYLQSGADAFLLKHGGGPFVPRRAFPHTSSGATRPRAPLPF